MITLFSLSALADPGCTLTTGPEVTPGIPSLRAECVWADVTPDDVDGVIARVGHHDDVFWMIAEEEVLRVEGDRTLVRQRHEVSPLRAREAEVWVTRRTHGEVRVTAWSRAEVQPEPVDALVPAAIEGEWRIEPDGHGGTRVGLTLAYDPAGWVPAFVVRTCQGSGARRALSELHASARQPAQVASR